MTASFTTLTVEEIGRVRRLTLNRPDHHNPLTPRCIREILWAVDQAEADAGASVIIIRSTGRSFSSGYGFIAEDTDPGDLPRHAAIEGDVSAMLALADGWARVWNCALPVIAQVQGNCLAGGTDLALAADYPSQLSLDGTAPTRRRSGGRHVRHRHQLAPQHNRHRNRHPHRGQYRSRPESAWAG